MVTRALFRSIPDSFTRAISRVAPEQPIDVAVARAQHAAYRAAFGDAQQLLVDADEACPDCVFVEDTAVILDGKALITRPGAASRLAETAPIARALAPFLDLVTMEPPATLDGGDVMVTRARIYVGRSARTNADGIELLRRVFGKDRVAVVGLPAGVLHLKCVVTPLGDGVVLADRSLSPELFPGMPIVRIPAEETYAANVVDVGDAVIAAAEFPRTLEVLSAAGYRVRPVPTTEVQKADGSLTCQSLRW
jgi:dimethylargininase